MIPGPPHEELTSPVIPTCRGSRDGWKMADLFKQCGNQGETLLVARSGNNVFGGYMDQPLTAHPSYSNSPNAWLFGLRANSMREPTRLQKTANGRGGCAYQLTRTSLQFGYGELTIGEGGAHGKTCSSDIGSYDGGVKPNLGQYDVYCFPGRDQRYSFTGSPTFNIDEVEIFRVVRGDVEPAPAAKRRKTNGGSSKSMTSLAKAVTEALDEEKEALQQAR